MTEMTTEEQMDSWKENLAAAMADEQWRLALKFCGWLRYTLSSQGDSDPEIEQTHRQAKEALSKQIAREKTQREHERAQEKEHLRLQGKAMHQIISADWTGAMDSIEVLYQDGANRQDAIRLLRELKMRTGTMQSPRFRQMNQRAATFGKRFDELAERIGGNLLLNKR